MIIPWVSILKSLLQLGLAIAEHLRNKKLIDAGEANAIASNLREQTIRLEKALMARRSVKHGDSSSMRNDPYNRS